MPRFIPLCVCAAALLLPFAARSQEPGFALEIPRYGEDLSRFVPGAVQPIPAAWGPPCLTAYDIGGNGSEEARSEFEVGADQRITAWRSYDHEVDGGRTAVEHRSEYDAQGRVSAGVVLVGGTERVEEVQYEYTADNVVQIGSADRLTVVTFDAAGRPIEETFDLGRDGIDSRSSLTYDLEGRLIRVEIFTEGDAPGSSSYAYEYESGALPSAVVGDTDGDSSPDWRETWRTYLDGTVLVRDRVFEGSGALADRFVYSMDPEARTSRLVSISGINLTVVTVTREVYVCSE